jgi:hypothetical protein
MSHCLYVRPEAGPVTDPVYRFLVWNLRVADKGYVLDFDTKGLETFAPGMSALVRADITLTGSWPVVSATAISNSVEGTPMEFRHLNIDSEKTPSGSMAVDTTRTISDPAMAIRCDVYFDKKK